MSKTYIVSEATGEPLFYSPRPETYTPGQQLKMPNGVTYKVVSQVGDNVYVQPADSGC